MARHWKKLTVLAAPVKGPPGGGAVFFRQALTPSVYDRKPYREFGMVLNICIPVRAFKKEKVVNEKL